MPCVCVRSFQHNNPFLHFVTVTLSASTATKKDAQPVESYKRVGTAEAFPNEYPGQIYAFNWCLNGDGVTPLRRSAFRITKPLDLKVAGLEPPKKIPLKVRRRCIGSSEKQL